MCAVLATQLEGTKVHWMWPEGTKPQLIGPDKITVKHSYVSFPARVPTVCSFWFGARRGFSPLPDSKSRPQRSISDSPLKVPKKKMQHLKRSVFFGSSSNSWKPKCFYPRKDSIYLPAVMQTAGWRSLTAEQRYLPAALRLSLWWIGRGQRSPLFTLAEETLLPDASGLHWKCCFLQQPGARIVPL